MYETFFSSEIPFWVRCRTFFFQCMLSNQALDKDRRASLISNYSKTVTQYKYDIMTLNFDTIQNTP